MCTHYTWPNLGSSLVHERCCEYSLGHGDSKYNLGHVVHNYKLGITDYSK